MDKNLSYYSLSLIIPVYNEIDNLGRLYESICCVLKSLGNEVEFIFVNDGSQDESGILLDALAAKDSRVRVIHFRRNYGQSAAMMAGFRNCRNDIVIPMDADLQNDPADIPKLLEKIDEGYDVVSGWRYDRKDAAIKRNFVSRVANMIISRLSGVNLHDYGCTLKAYRRDVIEDIKLYGEMHRFIPIYASWEGARVTEVPVSHHPRRFGKSKYGLTRIPRVILDLIVIRFLDKALDRPMQFFGRAGLLSLGLASIVAVWALWLKLISGVSFILTPLPLLTVLLFITGVLCILMGLLAEMQSRTYFEARGKAHYSVSRVSNIPAPVR